MLISQSIKILVVEDDYLVGEEIVRTLRTMGYRDIIEAANGFEAVGMAFSLKPDLILMDIKMPEIDGLEAAREIQESCPTPVVILTAYETQELIDKASEVGVGAYLTKPPSADELARAIAVAMARHKDLMELRLLNRELEKKLAEVKQLKGILPICASCKKVRDDKGYWNQIEQYIKDHSEADFSHGICPDCTQKMYPELSDAKGTIRK